MPQTQPDDAPQRSASNTGTDAGSTRERLLRAALHLFASHGFDAVSLRMINTAAKARNASAVHYHFGSKSGVQVAVLDRVRDRLDAARTRELDKLEAETPEALIPDGTDRGLRAVLGAWLDAYLDLVRDDAIGKDALGFLGRIAVDPDPKIQRALASDPHGSVKRFHRLLGQVMPQLTGDLRQTRYLFMWTLMVQMLATADVWARTPVGDLRNVNTSDARGRLLDFLCGGFAAGTGLGPGFGADTTAEAIAGADSPDYATASSAPGTSASTPAAGAASASAPDAGCRRSTQ